MKLFVLASCTCWIHHGLWSRDQTQMTSYCLMKSGWVVLEMLQTIEMQSNPVNWTINPKIMILVSLNGNS